VAAIGEGRRPTGMAADEKAVYDFCAELRENKSVSDASYARAANAFGEQGVVDMAGLVGYYTTLAMIMARTPLPEGKKSPLVPFPR
jgi:4-carboxymuconolactone decarboxylase